MLPPATRTEDHEAAAAPTSPSAMSVWRSLSENWLSWLVVLLAVSAVSFPQIPTGIATFLVLIVVAYLTHWGSHFYRNLFTIIHHYHHEQDNFFSHFAQIIIELGFGFWLLPAAVIVPDITRVVNVWALMLFALFYCTVHNWNYGQCHVNEVHREHHESILHNIGPDICDVAFGTKHPNDTTVENTNHYIPNVLLMAALVLLVKFSSQQSPEAQQAWINLAWVVGTVAYSFLAISSVVLYFTYK